MDGESVEVTSATQVGVAVPKEHSLHKAFDATRPQPLKGLLGKFPYSEKLPERADYRLERQSLFIAKLETNNWRSSPEKNSLPWLPIAVCGGAKSDS
jgi:hypothetical protein